MKCPHCEVEKCKHVNADGSFKKEKYTIKFEVLVPAIVTYDLELETPEDIDLKRIKTIKPKSVQYFQPRTLYKKVFVYRYLSSIIKFWRLLS